MLEDAKMGDIDVGVFKEMFATGLHRILRIYGETKGNSALVGIKKSLLNIIYILPSHNLNQE